MPMIERKIQCTWLRGVLVFLLVGAAVQILPAASVSAYSTEQKFRNNLLSVGDHITEIEEKFEPPEEILPNTSYEKVVAVRNCSDIPCYVRVFVEKDQRDLPVTMDFDTENWTEKQEDGYYYYRTVLDAQETTKPLFTSVFTGEDISDFRILIYEETVQAEGHATAVEAFAAIRGEQESGT